MRGLFLFSGAIRHHTVMRLILTAAEMGAVDRRTAEQFGVPVADLMERAGGAVALFCLREYPDARRVTVICGKGNNGGDGLVAARAMALAGVEVTVLVLAGSAGEVGGLAGAALARLREEAGAVRVVFCGDEGALAAEDEALVEADLLVDAIVGTGFKAPLRGPAEVVRRWVRELAVPVVAVDLPSGWDADSMNQDAAGAMRADAVVTFTAPKMAQVFGHLASSSWSSARRLGRSWWRRSGRLKLRSRVREG